MYTTATFTIIIILAIEMIFIICIPFVIPDWQPWMSGEFCVATGERELGRVHGRGGGPNLGDGQHYQVRTMIKY